MKIKGTKGRSVKPRLGNDFAIGDDKEKVRIKDFKMVQIAGVEFSGFVDR